MDVLASTNGRERTVEGPPHGVLADRCALLAAKPPEPLGEGGADADLILPDLVPRQGLEESGVNSCGSGRHRSGDRLDAPFGGSSGALVRPRFLLPEQMPVLVEHRLEIPLAAVAKDLTPVRPLVGAGARGPEQRDHGGSVEEPPERVRDGDR